MKQKKYEYLNLVTHIYFSCPHICLNIYWSGYTWSLLSGAEPLLQIILSLSCTGSYNVSTFQSQPRVLVIIFKDLNRLTAKSLKNSLFPYGLPALWGHLEKLSSMFLLLRFGWWTHWRGLSWWQLLWSETIWPRRLTFSLQCLSFICKFNWIKRNFLSVQNWSLRSL